MGRLTRLVLGLTNATGRVTGNQMASLNSTDFMGNPYIVYQTMQCPNTPAANMTLVMVEPQATDAIVPVKTPEEPLRSLRYSGRGS
jgi:hypothetical protein